MRRAPAFPALALPSSLAKTQAAWCVLVVAACTLGACAEYSHADLPRVAADLDVDLCSDGCRHTVSELTRRDHGAVFAISGLSESPQEWSCPMMFDNLRRDSTQAACLPRLSTLLTSDYGTSQKIAGGMSYMGVAPLPYRYDIVSNAAGRPVVSVRIALTGELADIPENVQHMQRKFNRASELWEDGAPEGAIRFVFRAVARSEDPHYEVELKPKCPRFPYNLALGLGCSSHLLAHEIGHMMGLDDEYNQLQKTLGHLSGHDRAWPGDQRQKLDWLHCDLGSLMCDSAGWQSKPRAYHYYLVLRRYFCQ
jgi:hypothetical protein